MNSLSNTMRQGHYGNSYSNYGVAGNATDTAYGQQPFYGTPTQERPITVDDVVTKTGITLAVIIAFAVINFGIGALGANGGARTMALLGLSNLLTIVGAIGGFVITLVAAFSKKWGSKVITLSYAVLEGLFVGGFSLMFAGVTVAGANGVALIGQAVLGTVGVFLGMLFVYKTGAVRMTPKFTKILIGCIIGVVVLSLGNLLLALFMGQNFLRDGGPLAIVFSLACIVLAALSFLTDFEQADHLIRQGAPSSTAWGVALGLAVTLVWLYTEILRLLSYFNRN